MLWRFDDPFNPEEDNAAGVPAEEGVAVAPTPSSSALAPAEANNCDGAVFAPEAAPAKGGGTSTASSSTSTAAPSATTIGLCFACRLSVPAPPPAMSTQAAPQALVFTGTSAAPPSMPASTPCRPSPKRMKMTMPSASRPAYAANPAIPAFPILAPPQQQEDADPDELRRAKVQRFAGLIAKKQQETAEHYRNLLRSGKAPPEPPKPKPAVDEEALRCAVARKRFLEALAQEEMKARGAALFVQMARPEHLRALGIDKAMERVVSPERPRDENGAPVVSPEHPCSLLEKLGYFLKVEFLAIVMQYYM
nr:translation initiation factor IF-2-like [Setaria viridis]